MRKLPFLFSVACAAFLAGVGVVWMFGLPGTASLPSEPESEAIVIHSDQPLAVIRVEDPANSDPVESRNPLDKEWVDGDFAEYGRISATRVCEQEGTGWTICKLVVRESGKIQRTFEVDDDNPFRLRFGFFDFLGRGDKQLVVFTYSGGAHCCYDYTIFDFEPRFRVIYDSSKYDSANEIGSELVPVDMDLDGVFEFHQRIEAFSYFHASYAASNKPTAVFAYNKKRRTYELANKRFPEYVLADTERTLKWMRDNPSQWDDVFVTRETFLNHIYSGDKRKAWEYYEKNYNFADKDEYRRDVRKLFKSEPVYRSIYHSGVVKVG